MNKNIVSFFNQFLKKVKNNNFFDAYSMLFKEINNTNLKIQEKEILSKTFASFNKYYFAKKNYYSDFDKKFLNFIARKNFNELINFYKYNCFFSNIKLYKYKKFLIKFFLDEKINFKNKYFILEILKQQKVNYFFIVKNYKKKYLINPQEIKIIKNSLIYLKGKETFYDCFYNIDKKKYIFLKNQYLVFLYDFYPNVINENEIKNFALSYIFFYLKKSSKTTENKTLTKILSINELNISKYLTYFNNYYDN
ncbi:hypothetical protein JTY60_02065 [symbiont of Argiope bruennichi]|uniref:hypothetical protein n=1 Tax=symbiont of Argiope bruennichi TaxID=2810479 RepID=UPI003DA2FB1A